MERNRIKIKNNRRFNNFEYIEYKFVIYKMSKNKKKAELF